MLVFLFFLASVLGWMRMRQALVYTAVLSRLEISIPPLYLAISGAVFGITLLAAGVWLWLGLPGYRPLTASVVILFTAWFWLDRLMLTRNPVTRTNDAFLLAATAFFLVFTLAVLAAHPPLNPEGKSLPSPPAPAEEDHRSNGRD